MLFPMVRSVVTHWMEVWNSNYDVVLADADTSYFLAGPMIEPAPLLQLLLGLQHDMQSLKVGVP